MLCRVRQACLVASCVTAAGALVGGPTLSAAHVKSWLRTTPVTPESKPQDSRPHSHAKKTTTPAGATLVAAGFAKLADTDGPDLVAHQSISQVVDLFPRKICGDASNPSDSVKQDLHQPFFRAQAPPL